MKHCSVQVRVVVMVIKSKAGIKLALFTARLLKKTSDLIYTSIETPSVDKQSMVFQNKFEPFLTSDTPPAEWAEKIAAAGEVQWFAWNGNTGLAPDTGPIKTIEGSASKKETDVHYTLSSVENIKDDTKAGFSVKKENRIFNKTTKTWIDPGTKKNIGCEFHKAQEIQVEPGYNLKEVPPGLTEKIAYFTNESIKITSPKSNILPKDIDEPFANLKEPVSVKIKKTFFNNKTKLKTIYSNSHGLTRPINTQTQPTTKYDSNSTSDFEFHIKSKKNGTIFKKKRTSSIETKTEMPLNRDKTMDIDISFRPTEKHTSDINNNKTIGKSYNCTESRQTMDSEIKTKAGIHTSASKGVWPKLPEITPPIWKHTPAVNVLERITILETEQKAGLWSV